jgi:polar amino acid transport system substrate-binding protein
MILMAFASLIAFAAVACGGAAEPEVIEKEVIVTKEVEVEVVKEVIVEKEVIVVAEAATVPLLSKARDNGLSVGFVQENPFGYINDKGECTGTDIEVTREAARRMGIEDILCVHIAWEGMLPATLSGRVDMIPVGMPSDAAKCEVLLFTDPYQTMGIAALVKAGNPKNIHSYEDFVDSDLILAGSLGALELIIAREDYGVPEERALGFGEQSQAVEAVKTGRADAALYTTNFVARYVLEQGDGPLGQAEPFVSPQYFNAGHMFRHEDAQFVAQWNDILYDMKVDGTIKRIFDDFEMAPESLLGTEVSSEQCCDDSIGMNYGCLPD